MTVKNNKNNNEIEIKTESEDKKKIDAEKMEPADPVKELKLKLESAEKESKDNYEHFLRVSAEFENYQKRSAREINDFRKYANESLLKDLLPVVDNLERAINLESNHDIENSGIIEGINLTLADILKVFEKFSVKPIESVHKPFDPAFHQAVSKQEDENHAENTVLYELQKGYTIHDRLLRPAMVVVVSNKDKDSTKNVN